MSRTQEEQGIYEQFISGALALSGKSPFLSGLLEEKKTEPAPKAAEAPTAVSEFASATEAAASSAAKSEMPMLGAMLGAETDGPVSMIAGAAGAAVGGAPGAIIGSQLGKFVDQGTNSGRGTGVNEFMPEGPSITNGSNGSGVGDEMLQALRHMRGLLSQVVSNTLKAGGHRQERM